VNKSRIVRDNERTPSAERVALSTLSGIDGAGEPAIMLVECQDDTGSCENTPDGCPGAEPIERGLPRRRTSLQTEAAVVEGVSNDPGWSSSKNGGPHGEIQDTPDAATVRSLPQTEIAWIDWLTSTSEPPKVREIWIWVDVP